MSQNHTWSTNTKPRKAENESETKRKDRFDKEKTKRDQLDVYDKMKDEDEETKQLATTGSFVSSTCQSNRDCSTGCWFRNVVDVLSI